VLAAAVHKGGFCHIFLSSRAVVWTVIDVYWYYRQGLEEESMIANSPPLEWMEGVCHHDSGVSCKCVQTRKLMYGCQMGLWEPYVRRTV